MILSSLSAGDKATVRCLNSKEDIRRRLQDMGIIDGTVIECLMISPLGDPAAYLVRGAVIALRKSESDTIEIFGDDD